MIRPRDRFNSASPPWKRGWTAAQPCGPLVPIAQPGLAWQDGHRASESGAVTHFALRVRRRAAAFPMWPVYSQGYRLSAT